jgi:hypothetical protein
MEAGVRIVVVGRAILPAAVFQRMLKKGKSVQAADEHR